MKGPNGCDFCSCKIGIGRSRITISAETFHYVNMPM